MEQNNTWKVLRGSLNGIHKYVVYILVTSLFLLTIRDQETNRHVDSKFQVQLQENEGSCIRQWLVDISRLWK